MTTVIVWLLVYSTAVNSGNVTNVVGDFRSAADCEVVRDAVLRQEAWKTKAQCVQVTKVR
jgi:hypothetical protein